MASSGVTAEWSRSPALTADTGRSRCAAGGERGEQRARLVLRFGPLRGRLAVRHDAAAGVHEGATVREHRAPDRDREVGAAAEVEVAERAGVEPAAHGLEARE